MSYNFQSSQRRRTNNIYLNLSFSNLSWTKPLLILRLYIKFVAYYFFPVELCALSLFFILRALYLWLPPKTGIFSHQQMFLVFDCKVQDLQTTDWQFYSHNQDKSDCKGTAEQWYNTYHSQDIKTVFFLDLCQFTKFDYNFMILFKFSQCYHDLYANFSTLANH